MLVFVVPVRHPGTVPDWAAVQARLHETARSIAAQDSRAWRAVVVAQAGAALPSLPAGFEVRRVDVAPPEVAPDATQQERYEAVRADKGRRVLAALPGTAGGDHVMTVDYDDWVSRRLAGTVEGHDGPGFYLGRGWRYDGGRFLSPVEAFHRVCGSSLIVRRSLLDVPDDVGQAGEGAVRRHLGSHRFLPGDLQERGTPLALLPYRGAVYRVGVAGSVTGAWGTAQWLSPRQLRHPRAYARRLAALRPVRPAHRREFGLAPRGH